MLPIEENMLTILPGFVKGVVYDTTINNPIVGAEIIVLDTSAFFTTGNDGEYFIKLPIDSYVLHVEADGYQPKEVEITITQNDQWLIQDIELQKIS